MNFFNRDLLVDEIESCKNVPVWLDERDGVFTCKLCRKCRPVSIKSNTKIGWCKLCTANE